MPRFTSIMTTRRAHGYKERDENAERLSTFRGNTRIVHTFFALVMMQKHIGSRFQVSGCVFWLLLFLAFNVLVANPKKLLYYTVANPARGLLNRENIIKENVLQRPPPPTLLVRRE